MGLVKFARRELELAGLFDKDSDYDGMLGGSAIELIEVFSKQGHSGFSAGIMSDLFDRLSRYKPLTALTADPEDWMEVGEGTWQCKRSHSCFSEDGLKTYYDIDDGGRENPKEFAVSGKDDNE